MFFKKRERKTHRLERREQSKKVLLKAVKSCLQPFALYDKKLKKIYCNAALVTLFCRSCEDCDTFAVDTKGTTLKIFIDRLIKEGKNNGSFTIGDPQTHKNKNKTLDVEIASYGEDSGLYIVSFFIKSQRGMIEQTEKSPNVENEINRITRIPNEKALQEKLRKIQLKKDDYLSQKKAIAVVEFENFILYRYFLGIEGSEEIVKKVAYTFAELANASGAMLYHTNNNRFIFFLENFSDTAIVEKLTKDIKMSLLKLESKEELSFHIKSSIGVAVFPDESGIKYLLENAYGALYQAKQHGGDNFYFYQKTAHDERGFVFLSQLQEGIKKRQFPLYYQPIVQSDGFKMVKAEALVRWHHPKKGILSPGYFLPTIVDIGLIVNLGEVVYTQVFETIHRWNRHRFEDVQISTNLTLVEVEDPLFLKRIEKLLERYPINPLMVKFEITEQDTAKSSKSAIRKMMVLRQMGFSIALDDFGTGYTSFARLKEFPADEIKIDRSLIRNILRDKDTQTIVKAMISMAHQLGFKCTVEGIENKEEADLIASYGCDYLQGYYFGKPISALEFQTFLQN